MTAVTTVPSSVAMGMVRPGSRTLLAGIVADSNPRRAHSVSVAAAVVPLTDSGMRADGVAHHQGHARPEAEQVRSRGVVHQRSEDCGTLADRIGQIVIALAARIKVRCLFASCVREREISSAIRGNLIVLVPPLVILDNEKPTHQNRFAGPQGAGVACARCARGFPVVSPR